MFKRCYTKNYLVSSSGESWNSWSWVLGVQQQWIEDRCPAIASKIALLKVKVHSEGRVDKMVSPKDKRRETKKKENKFQVNHLKRHH